ncbi:MAG: type II toxin-antitoxin system prevent-host-death family antitoxin [Acidaminococcales bacterium]|jgi:prevent-host-death family protein|nr:type II toxin-antitoxin system prevent-host-death family antitoxin [Acidaminococcales bacterium]
MVVTATDFKSNIGKYLALVKGEDILITKNGKSIAKLSNAAQSKVDSVKSLAGIIPNNGMTLKQAKEERVARYEIAD